MLASQILSMVIRPALSKINLWSPSAEELVLGTAIVESGFTYLRQWGDGPALGLWQVEPSTQNDLYTNFLNYRPELGSQLMELRAPNLSMDENLATNLMYGAAVCRLCYYRKPVRFQRLVTSKAKPHLGSSITTRLYLKACCSAASGWFACGASLA